MAFTLNIATDNAAFHDEGDGDAFDPGPELARILRKLADTLDGPDRYPDNGMLRDVNGNRVDRVHRLATGDRLRSHYIDFEVIAII